MNAQEIENGLSQFTGTEQWHKHFLGMLYTDGIEYLAEQTGAYWLIDLVASWQPHIRKRLQAAGERDFQVWRLRQTRGRRYVVDTWMDMPGDSMKLATQNIPYSDFPLAIIEFYVEDGMMLLKSER